MDEKVVRSVSLYHHTQNGDISIEESFEYFGGSKDELTQDLKEKIHFHSSFLEFNFAKTLSEVVSVDSKSFENKVKNYGVDPDLIIALQD